VFPRLVAADYEDTFAPGDAPSGNAELDALLGGGLARGSSTLIVGPAGTGKTSVAIQYALAATRRGETVVFYSFEESLGTLHARTRGLGWDLEGAIENGRLVVELVNPAELSPGEFAYGVRRMVDEKKTSMVVIDSLNGYMNAMPQERHLSLHLHELLSYLGQKGVATLMIVAQHGLVGTSAQSPVDLSYLSDAVIVVRYFEDVGEVRVAVSVLKKRSGAHERTIRELRMSRDGIHLGPPLREYHGVFGGAPVRKEHARPAEDEPARTD